MLTAEVKFTGIEKVVGNLNRLSLKQRRILERFGLQKAEWVLRDSKEKNVPVNNGTLRNSGRVVNQSKQSTKVNQISFQVAFGGAARAYAIAVHETPSDFDPPSWKGKVIKFKIGGSKYLEKSFNAMSEEFESDLAKEVANGFW